MNCDNFMAYCERCKKVWLEFKKSYKDSSCAPFIKHSYPVLSCVNGSIRLDELDIHSIAISSPASFTDNRASNSLIKHAKLLEELKKETEVRSKAKRNQIEKWLREFDRQHLKFEEHRLEIRFPYLKMDLIQEIKESSFVDSKLTNMALASIRVVLSVSNNPKAEEDKHECC